MFFATKIAITLGLLIVLTLVALVSFDTRAKVSTMVSLFLSEEDTISYPVIEVEGTHYEVAYKIGTSFRERIVDFHRRYTKLHEFLLPFLRTNAGKKIFADYLEAVNASYPQYLDEMRGVSDSTGLPFEQIFALHMEPEIVALNRSERMVLDCSDVIVNYPHSTIIAHNEDTNPLTKKRGYFVVAKIKNTNPRGLLTAAYESYTSFSYPGYLQGNNFGFLASGLVFTIDGLYPKYPQMGTYKIPRYVLNRAVLSARSLNDIETILKNEGFGCSFGFSLNVADLSVKPVTVIYNYEVAPNPWPRSVVSVLKILQTNVTRSKAETLKPNERKGHYFHVNAYEHLNIIESPIATVSSAHRKQRAGQLPDPVDLASAINILGDTADKGYPIFRTPRPTDKAETVATAIFDLTKFTLDIYTGNPKHNEPVLNFTLPST